MRVAALCLLVFVSGEAHASYCKPLKELLRAVDSCDQNERYAEAAVDCLESLERRVAAASQGLALAMKAHQGGKQDKSFGSSKADYRLSEQTLNLLLAQTEASAKEVLAYGKNVVFPEDFDSDEAVAGNVEGFLREPCFSDTHDILDSVLGELKRHHESLSAVKQASISMKQDSATSQKNIEVEADSGTKVLRGQPGSPSHVQGGDGNQSGVSGKEKLKK